MFKITRLTRVLMIVLFAVSWFSIMEAPTWYESRFHGSFWVEPVYAQSSIRNFTVAPTSTTGFLIAKGSTTQEFYVTQYGLTVATGLTSTDAFNWVYGDTTGAADCNTNRVNIGATFTTASGVTQFNKEMTPTGNPVMRIPRGHDLCIVGNVPAVNIDGFVSGFYQSE